MDLTRPQRILVIRLSSLGDVALTAPVYRNLKAAWPDAHIAVLTKPAYAPLLADHPCVDEVIAFTGLVACLRHLRRRHFTHLLDLHANWRSFWIRKLSGIPQQSRYQKNSFSRRLFVLFRKTSASLQKHTLDRYLAALTVWGIEARQRSLLLADALKSPMTGAPISPKNILVIQTAFLGDLALTKPLILKLQELFPHAPLSALIRPEMAALLSDVEAITLILDDKKRRHKGLLGTWRLVQELRQRRFDLAVIPHRSLRSALIAFLCGIPKRVGFAASAGKWLLTDALSFNWLMHDRDRNLSLIHAVSANGGAVSESAPLNGKSASPRTSGDAVFSRLRGAGIRDGEVLVGVHPGSVWPTKRWLPERFSQLIARLDAQGLRAVIIGESRDASLARQILSGAGNPAGALDWTGQTGLAELMALMRHLRLFITNDSGPMHIATSCGVPTLAIFGPTTKELGFFPYGDAHRVVESDLECRPCSLHGGRACPLGHFLCMKLITVDQVHAAAMEMLRQHENCSNY
ncbi:MAG: lipopolysaccharide heptosyltransferase II [Elusimicrobia bacterium]|nr:lipopolysaccharide heptosyltransferase II [Elusimicrobiota bacterium]